MHGWWMEGVGGYVTTDCKGASGAKTGRPKSKVRLRHVGDHMYAQSQHAFAKAVDPRQGQQTTEAARVWGPTAALASVWVSLDGSTRSGTVKGHPWLGFWNVNEWVIFESSQSGTSARRSSPRSVDCRAPL